MATPLDALEIDFFGDLVEDTHGLWEIFEFVRLHYRELNDQQVLERGRLYIADWIRAGWIRISDAPLYPSTITNLPDILQFLQHHGSAATRYWENSPSIDPTEEALRVYENQTA
jgi:hypothetical protein